MSEFKWPNPFLVNVPILYPPKTPDKESFSGVISGYKIETLAQGGLRLNRFFA